jgi:TPR repeat protein
LFDAGCTAGDAASCAALAAMYQLGNGEPVDLPRATQLYDRACAARLASACVQAGHLYRHAGDDTTAHERYDQACTAGDTLACRLLIL